MKPSDDWTEAKHVFWRRYGRVIQLRLKPQPMRPDPIVWTLPPVSTERTEP